MLPLCKHHTIVQIIARKNQVGSLPDFFDPQGGKGPCDRKAAQIKTHVKQYINEDHSVATPYDLKKAIESNEGIAGVRVTVVPVPKTTEHQEHQVGRHQ